MRNRKEAIHIDREAPVLLSDGCRKLWLAALEGAMVDLQLAHNTKIYTKKIQNPSRNYPHPDEERAWIVSDAVYPGSFRWICQGLGLDPSYWRRGLLRLAPRPAQRTAVERANHILRRDAARRLARRQSRAKAP